MNSDHKRVAKQYIRRINKKQPQEQHDLKHITDRTRNRNENKEFGEHRQTKIKNKKVGERKIGNSIEQRTKKEQN